MNDDKMIIAIDHASGTDQTAISLHIGDRVHVIPDPFAHILADHIKELEEYKFRYESVSK